MQTATMHEAAADAAANRKRQATLTAHLALRGQQVHRLECGGFLVVWQSLCRHCKNLDELEQHARRVGAIK